jgi:hypothetical protein
VRRRSLFAFAGVCVSALLLVATRESQAQAGLLPPSEADALLDAGRWADAEEMLYAGVRLRPRDPIARARLGRYLAMKGALKPGLVLIDEAAEFGLPAPTARALAAPIRTLLAWRERQAAGAHDSSVVARAPVGEGALLRFRVVRGSRGDTLWADLVPRMIGLDSAAGANPRVGIEMLEALVPTYDVANHMLRLHADPRDALGALGRRYPVLRTARDVRVLLAPGRVRSLPDALRELSPQWWQLDLLHGILIVR